MFKYFLFIYLFMHLVVIITDVPHFLPFAPPPGLCFKILLWINDFIGFLIQPFVS